MIYTLGPSWLCEEKPEGCSVKGVATEQYLSWDYKGDVVTYVTCF
jgi:hypothetical protein